VTVLLMPASRPQHSKGASSRACATIWSRMCCGIERSDMLDGAGDAVISAEVLDRRSGAAERAMRVLRARDLAELHFQCIVNHELVRQRFSDAENFLDRFRGL